MEHMRWLTLRLGNNQSIGPKVLSDLWSNACETNQSSVTRDTMPGKSTSYALHAPLSLAPEQAKWAGISWADLMTWMVDHARRPS